VTLDGMMILPNDLMMVLKEIFDDLYYNLSFLIESIDLYDHQSD
jgi:hypothetical protein